MPSLDRPPTEWVLSEAKLAPPRARRGVIPRPRLFAELDSLGDVELTLVSAAAGFGKTVAVASWLDQRPDLAVAWVTLDESDEDPLRLWTAVATAVDRLRPGIARPALATLRTPRCQIETAVDQLLNGMAGYDGRVVIILDDLHYVAGGGGLRLLAYAVERLPRTTRIVATTRSDPAIRLGRLRAHGELAELRTRNLAFTLEETSAFLADHPVGPLEREDVGLLVERTEGWPAGIALAAMWLARSENPRDDLRQFSATNRHVADYLTSEVLDALDDDVRAFLTTTSVLRRFTAELCDVALQADDSAERLAALAQSNLFIVPLDGRGEWYRYHHLFRELLMAELASTASAASAITVHKRAARWFRERGLIEDALEHTAATDDPPALADLLEDQHRELVRNGMAETFLRWLERLPGSELARRPTLAAIAGLTSGLVAQAATVRRRYATVAETGAAALAHRERMYVESMVALTRGALLDRDLGTALEEAENAAHLARRCGDELVVPTLAVIAYGRYLAGDHVLARAAADEALGRPEAHERPHGLVFAHGVHALLESDGGRPQTAEDEARSGVMLGRELGLSGAWSAGIVHHALGQALLARGNAQDAERELERASALRHASEPRLDSIHSLIELVRARIARGRLTLAASELATAREALTAFADAGQLPEMAADVDLALAEALAGNQPMIEPPSAAELSILRLMASDLSQREIGEELFLSLNTIKTHSRKLYNKLRAHSREEAVHKAHVLGLIEPASPPEQTRTPSPAGAPSASVSAETPIHVRPASR